MGTVTLLDTTYYSLKKKSKLDFIKIQNFCFMIDNVKGLRLATEEKIFAKKHTYQSTDTY